MNSTRLYHEQEPYSHQLESEWASKRMNECSGACEQSKQYNVSELVSSASKRANERIDERVAQYSMRLFLNHPTHRAASSNMRVARHPVIFSHYCHRRWSSVIIIVLRFFSLYWVTLSASVFFFVCVWFCLFFLFHGHSSSSSIFIDAVFVC